MLKLTFFATGITRRPKSPFLGVPGDCHLFLPRRARACCSAISWDNVQPKMSGSREGVKACKVSSTFDITTEQRSLEKYALLSDSLFAIL